MSKLFLVLHLDQQEKEKSSYYRIVLGLKQVVSGTHLPASIYNSNNTRGTKNLHLMHDTCYFRTPWGTHLFTLTEKQKINLPYWSRGIEHVCFLPGEWIGAYTDSGWNIKRKDFCKDAQYACYYARETHQKHWECQRAGSFCHLLIVFNVTLDHSSSSTPRTCMHLHVYITSLFFFCFFFPACKVQIWVITSNKMLQNLI